jgi:hypothetical protein
MSGAIEHDTGKEHGNLCFRISGIDFGPSPE